MTYFIYHIIEKRKHSQLNYLIQNVDDIIDHKQIEIIDGEGEIALLSHKLFTLNKRYYALIEQMHQEQLKLKDYIEDISHQLKTPITSMRINEELLLESSVSQKQKDQLVALHTQTLKMNDLVNDLLTLALIDSQSIEFQFQDYPIEVLIEDIEEDLDYLLIEKEMNIELHYSQEKILCDKKWFEEALKNIIKNCIEKNEKSIVSIDVETIETLTILKIHDQGKGFIEEDIPHLFDRFYRGKNKDYEGVGIGLALSKAIIEQHHGIIEARNDHGALFEIRIPKLLAKKKL